MRVKEWRRGGGTWTCTVLGVRGHSVAAGRLPSLRIEYWGAPRSHSVENWLSTWSVCSLAAPRLASQPRTSVCSRVASRRSASRRSASVNECLGFQRHGRMRLANGVAAAGAAHPTDADAGLEGGVAEEAVLMAVAMALGAMEMVAAVVTAPAIWVMVVVMVATAAAWTAVAA